MRLSAACAAALAAVLVVSGAPGAAPTPQPPPVLWGDREFDDPADLASWLSARGASYERWAELHPLAAQRLEGEAPAGDVAVEAEVEAEPEPEPVRPYEPLEEADESLVPGRWLWGVAAAVLGSAALAVAAATVAARRRGRPVLRAVEPLDLALLSGAVVLGLALVVLLGRAAF